MDEAAWGAAGGRRRLERDRGHALLRRKDRQPRDEPQRSEQRRDDEAPLPADVEGVDQEDEDERRRDDRAELRAGVEEATRARSGGGGKEAGQRLDPGGVIATLRQPHQKTQHHEPGEPGAGYDRQARDGGVQPAEDRFDHRARTGKGVQAADDRPDREDGRQAGPGTDAIDERPGGNLTDHHPEVEGHGDERVLRVGPLPVRAAGRGRIAQERREHRQRLPVEQVDRDRRRQQADDGPAFRLGDLADGVERLGTSAAGRRVRGCHARGSPCQLALTSVHCRVFDEVSIASSACWVTSASAKSG